MNTRKILSNLVDLVFAASLVSIAIIWITGGVRINCVGLDLISLKRPILALLISGLIKRRFFGGQAGNFVVNFINKYPLEKVQLFIFFISLLFTLFISDRIVTKILPGGDEPHFLMIASSIAKDGDLNLRNNQDNGDFYEFYPGPIAPHAKIYNDTEIYSAHGIGVPLLILPGYILANRYGAVLVMNIVSALLTVAIFSLTLLVIKNRILSIAVSFLISFTIPLVFYSFQIYAELPGALIVTYLFLVISSSKDKSLSLYRIIIIGLLLACLPWFHVRYTFFVVLISLYLLYTTGLKKAFPSIGIALISFCLLLGYMKYYFGEMSLSAQYTDIGESIKWPLSGLFGNMIDSRFGLLLYSPFYIFTGAGLYFLYIKNKRLFFWWTIFTTPFIIGVSSFYHWHGGCCPPLRYIVPVIPLFAIPIGCILTMYKNYFFCALFSVLVYISFIMKNILSGNTILMVNYEYSDSGILNYLKTFNMNLYWLFPTITDKLFKTYLSETAWAVFAALFTYVIIADYRKKLKSH